MDDKTKAKMDEILRKNPGLVESISRAGPAAQKPAADSNAAPASSSGSSGSGAQRAKGNNVLSRNLPGHPPSGRDGPSRGRGR